MKNQEQNPTSKQETINKLDIEIASLLNNESLSDEEKKELEAEVVKNTYEAFKEVLDEVGGEVREGTNAIKDVLDVENSLMVRRENPIWLFDALDNKKDLEIKMREFADNQLTGNKKNKYANAIILKRGEEDKIENAFFEGRGEIGGLVTTIGFKPSENMEVSELEDNFKAIGTITREHVRSVAGSIGVGDLRFVIIRIPAVPSMRFPEEELSEKEREKAVKVQAEWDDYCKKEEEYMDAKRKKILHKMINPPQMPTKPEPYNIFRTFVFNEKKDDIDQLVDAV